MYAGTIAVVHLRGVLQLQLHEGVAPDRGARGRHANGIHHREPVKLAHGARLGALRRTGYVKLHRNLQPKTSTTKNDRGVERVVADRIAECLFFFLLAA